MFRLRPSRGFVLAVVAVAVPTAWLAAGPASMHVFTNGAVASADDVNENFSALTTALQGFDGATKPCPGGGTQTFSGSTWTWSACPANWDCTTAPTHAGCVSGSTYTSCLALDNDPTFVGGDGRYWIDPDGSGTDAPVESYCLFSKGGGGWTLVLNVDTGDGNNLQYGNTAFWASTAAGQGSVAAALTSDYKNLNAYKSLSASRILIMAHEEGAMRAWRAWVVANPNTPGTFWAASSNTILTTSSFATENDQTLDPFEAIVRPPGQLVVNRQYGTTTSLDRARIANNQSASYTTATTNNGDNVLDGIGHDMDINNGAPGSWWDAGYGWDNASYTKARMGTDEPPDPWATTNSRNLHYDYAVFVR